MYHVIESVESNLGEYKFYEHHVILTAYEGVDINLQHSSEIVSLLNRKMKKPFGWISNKVNSYSANPLIMLDVVPNVPLLKSYCGVIYNDESKDYTKYGKKVVPVDFPLGKFNDINEAVEWTLDIVGVKDL